MWRLWRQPAVPESPKEIQVQTRLKIGETLQITIRDGRGPDPHPRQLRIEGRGEMLLNLPVESFETFSAELFPRPPDK